MRRLRLWTPQEDEILAQVSCTAKSKKWKKASEELRKRGFDRTDAQCRERYVNHLDPSVNKQLWAEDELETLYSKYAQYGNKWFLLQKHLPGRTQTKIKNYFYGNIRYLLKLILKYFVRTSTGFINDIKTDTLLNIYESKEEYEGFAVVSKTIKKLKFKVERQPCESIIAANKEEFYQFIRYFLEHSKLKATICQQQSEEEPTERTEKPTAMTIQCQPIKKEQHEPQSEEFLRSMAQYHFQLYRRYQEAYEALLDE